MCQKAHWKNGHKQECGQVRANFNHRSRRASNQTYYGLLTAEMHDDWIMTIQDAYPGRVLPGHEVASSSSNRPSFSAADAALGQGEIYQTAPDLPTMFYVTPNGEDSEEAHDEMIRLICAACGEPDEVQRWES